MTTYAIRRILQAIPVILILSACLFFLIRLTPGGPLAAYERNPNISRQQLELMRQKLGLDDPLPVQYVRWLGGVLQGDLGMSIKFRRPVAEMILERVPNTALLVGAAFILTLLIALPVGVLSARKPYSFLDYLFTSLSFMGQSVPIYWLGLVMILIFYVWLNNPFSGAPLMPSGGMYSLGGEKNLLDLLWHLVLPVVTLSLAWAAWYSRFLRASMLDVLHEDYIRTARAKGLVERLVIYKHALRNAVIPLVTMMALDLPSLFSGGLYIETIFSWPGMGRLFWDAARTRDYPVLLGIVVINAVLIVAFNILADLLYARLDPRVRYE
ncbi:MAG: ABC transporter permease [Anaerolineae bacterium]|nr:ABC transporter permease [Anaerolineae bacterium]